MSYLISLVILLFISLPAWAAAPIPPVIPAPYTCVTNYYVATTGSDTHGGTNPTTDAWLTVNHGLSQLVTITSGAAAGYCLNVLPGTYTEDTNTGYTISGTDTSPTGWFVVRSTTLHGAIIQVKAADAGTGKFYNNFQFNHFSYIVIDGFDLEGQNSVTGANDVGVNTASSGSTASHLTVINCIIANHGGAGIGINHVDYLIAEGNSVFNNAWRSTFQESGISSYQAVASDSNSGYHNIIEWNVVYGNMEKSTIAGAHTDGNGIILDDFRNTQNASPYGAYTQKSLVENNLTYMNGGGGVHVFLSDNIDVINNTSYFEYQDTLNTATAFRGCINVNEGNNITFVNNIAYADTSITGNVAYVDQNFVTSNTGNSFHNNLSFNGTPGQDSFSSHGTTSTFTSGSPLFNVLGADPLFTNVSSDIFTIQSGSPAIGAGTSSFGYPVTDLQGFTVSPASITLGGYQYLPQNLSKWQGTFNGVLN